MYDSISLSQPFPPCARTKNNQTVHKLVCNRCIEHKAKHPIRATLWLKISQHQRQALITLYSSRKMFTIFTLPSLNHSPPAQSNIRAIYFNQYWFCSEKVLAAREREAYKGTMSRGLRQHEFILTISKRRWHSSERKKNIVRERFPRFGMRIIWCCLWRAKKKNPQPNDALIILDNLLPAERAQNPERDDAPGSYRIVR